MKQNKYQEALDFLQEECRTIKKGEAKKYVEVLQELVNKATPKELIYGKEAQSRQAMEECAELVQAINKCLRYPNKEECKDNLIEEIADVEIMLYQLKEMFYINETEIYEWKEKKAKREKKRLKNVENKGDICD